MEHNFFTDHYKLLLFLTLFAITAGVIFFMALPTTFQIGLLAASALFLLVMMLSSDEDEPPCGAAVQREGIVRPPSRA